MLLSLNIVNVMLPIWLMDSRQKTRTKSRKKSFSSHKASSNHQVKSLTMANLFFPHIKQVLRHHLTQKIPKPFYRNSLQKSITLCLNLKTAAFISLDAWNPIMKRSQCVWMKSICWTKFDTWVSFKPLKSEKAYFHADRPMMSSRSSLNSCSAKILLFNSC